MLTNYLTIILRNLRKDRFHAFVNLLGLVTGLTAFILISLFIRKELSYDQFHSQKSRLHRVVQLDTETGARRGVIPPDYAESMMVEVPAIEGFTRLTSPKSRNLTQTDERGVYTNDFFYTDADFFNLFDFPLVTGEKGAVLRQSLNAVITVSFAKKLFGDNNPIGRELKLNKEQTLLVTGVCEDPPENSTIRFDILAKAPVDQFLNTINQGYLRSVTTYFMLTEEANPDRVEQLISNSQAKEAYHFFFENMAFELMPVTDQHLRSGLEQDQFEISDIRVVYLFGGIGLVILLLAVINYINMVIARALRRTREIGLRKVIGAQKSHLVSYQLLESILITTIAMALAFALAERFIPLLNNGFGTNLKLDYFSVEFIVFIPLLGVILGILSGFYPAFYINRYNSLVLLNNQLSGSRGKERIRRLLVGFQFVVASIMVLVTVIMNSQMQFLKQKDIGFEKELLVYIPLFEELKGSSQTFKNEVLSMAGISSATITNWMMGDYVSSTRYTKRVDTDSRERPPKVGVTLIRGDQDVVQTLGLEVLEKEAGFDLDLLDTTHVIISESVKKEVFGKGEAIGKYLYSYGGEKRRVVAVISDFHSGSFKQELVPTVVEFAGIWSDENLIIRFDAQNHQQTVENLKERYESLLNRPFEYAYIDDEIDKFYRQEAGYISLFNTFSGLAVLLSLLGLLAMASYTTSQRQKEVSIRKVLGASVRELLLMLNKEHTWLTLIAFAIAVPLSIYVMRDWLANFKYHIQIGPSLFVLAILGFLTLNVLITLVYTLRVSRANPAYTLRNE